MYTVGPVYYGHLGTNHKCPDYAGQFIWWSTIWAITKGVDYASVLIFKCPD